MKYVKVDPKVRYITPEDKYNTTPCVWLLRAYDKNGRIEDHEYFCTERRIQELVLEYYTAEANWGGWAGADYYKRVCEDN